MASNAPGRHRAPGRHNPLIDLKVIAKTASAPAVRGAAVVAASGGLVAGFAAPSQAAQSSVSSHSVAAPAVKGPTAGTPSAGNALSTIGLSTAPTAAKSATKVKPKVIEDILVKERRAAAAKKAADKREAAKKAAEARAKAAAERATAARASRTSTRAALPTKTTTKKATNTTPAPTQSASGLVGIAQRAFGVPYRWGGTSMSGFDCSGLTQWVYRQAGISIPRTASAQQRAATRVSSPRPGDLVFFGYPAYHVGIYVSPGRQIDAQRTGTVVGNHSIWTTPAGYGRF